MIKREKQLRHAAEASLAATEQADASAAENLLPAQELLHELHVHQIELQMQNESLRLAQMELEASRDRYVDLYEFAPVAYLTLTRSGRIEEINLTGVALLGGDRRELLGKRFLKLIVPEDHDKWQSYFLQAFKQEGKHCCELELQRSDDKRITARLDCLCSAPGTNLLRITLSDISERRKAENELHESQMRWQFAVESHGDAMWDWDADKDELFLTAAAKELFNLPDTRGNRPIADLLAQVLPEDQALIRDQLDDILRGRTSEWSCEYRISWFGESPRWLATSGRVMKRGNDGKPHRIVSISHDVTERNRKDSEASRQRDLIAHQGRLVLLGEMATALAHEINQPLTAITGFAAACARKAAGTPEALELIYAIEEQAMRAGDIAWRMRGFARRQQLGRSAVSLHEVVAGVAKWIHMDNARRDVAIDITGVLANLAHVNAERVELEQVLVNLVRNSIEASLPETKGQRIAISAAPGERPGEIEITVTDWGCGLPAMASLEAFQPFVSSKKQGLGLGLTICYSIIEGHGGRLWATENPAGGTIFHFTLPLAGVQAQEESE